MSDPRVTMTNLLLVFVVVLLFAVAVELRTPKSTSFDCHSKTDMTFIVNPERFRAGLEDAKYGRYWECRQNP